MGRLHSNGKGISASAIPYSRTAPAWLKTSPEAVVEQITKLARKGATPSQIGEILRDSHGIAQVKIVTGNKILRILKGTGMYFMSTDCCATFANILDRACSRNSRYAYVIFASRLGILY